MNIKGSLGDLLTIVIIFFVFSVITIMAYKISVEFEDTTNEAKMGLDTGIIDSTQSALKTFNYSSVLIIVALGVAAVLFAFAIRTHPAFLVVAIIFLMVLIVVAAQISSAFNEIATQPEMTSSANEFSIMVTLARKLPLFVLGFGALIMIVLFGKTFGGQE